MPAAPAPTVPAPNLQAPTAVDALSATASRTEPFAKGGGSVAGGLPGLHLPGKFESQFGLLGTFAAQFGRAWESLGGKVDPPLRAGEPAIFLFFNNPPSPEALHKWMGPVLGPRAVLQWCVDHPLTMPPAHLDRFASIPQYRLLTVADDDTHLLPLRFPAMRTARVWHGVDESALCPPESIRAEREVDLIIAGSIASDAQIESLRAKVPGAMQPATAEVIDLRTRHPLMSFGQAWDIAFPRLDHPTDHWGLLANVFAYATAAVNKTRRTALVNAMQGVRTRLVGTETLKSLSGGTVQYGGECAYESLPQELTRAKVCLALGPTQFAHAFSERLLLSLAAGCATVADDRACVRREFCGQQPPKQANPVTLYDASDPAHARAQVESLLADDTTRLTLGAAGRAIIADHHLWRHRAADIAALARTTTHAR